MLLRVVGQVARLPPLQAGRHTPPAAPPAPVAARCAATRAPCCCRRAGLPDPRLCGAGDRSRGGEPAAGGRAAAGAGPVGGGGALDLQPGPLCHRVLVRQAAGKGGASVGAVQHLHQQHATRLTLTHALSCPPAPPACSHRMGVAIGGVKLEGVWVDQSSSRPIIKLADFTRAVPVRACAVLRSRVQGAVEACMHAAS